MFVTWTLPTWKSSA